LPEIRQTGSSAESTAPEIDAQSLSHSTGTSSGMSERHTVQQHPFRGTPRLVSTSTTGLLPEEPHPTGNKNILHGRRRLVSTSTIGDPHGKPRPTGKTHIPHGTRRLVSTSTTGPSHKEPRPTGTTLLLPGRPRLIGSITHHLHYESPLQNYQGPRGTDLSPR
jgi:hypothetical protein